VAIMAVLMSQRSYPQRQSLACMFASSCLAGNVPKFWVSHASSVVRPPMLTSSPSHPSSIAEVAPQDTRDPATASPLPHTKPRAHVLTQKA
jgi:hypothetical protein